MSGGSKLRAAFAGAFALVFVGACTRGAAPPPAGAEPGDATTASSALFARGRQVYLSNCAACHHLSDPSKDGNVGPGIAGASTDLIRARVLEAKYPEGYKPKRSTTLMVAMPQLKDEIDALAAFLAGK